MTGKTKAFMVRTLSDDLSGCAMGEIELPAPGPGEVQIKVRAVALGFPDLLMTRGGYQMKPALPFVPGMEAAGEVLALGDGVTTTSGGERVLFGSFGSTGLLAERANVPADRLRTLPDNFSYAEGAAFTTAYLTAYVGLVRAAGGIGFRETVLVHGAAGGVGLAAVELAKHLGGRVIATASTEEKRALATSKGADLVLDPAEGFREKVKALTDGRGADVIFDPVGGDVFDESLRCIAWGGRFLVIGFASGRIGQVGANIPLIKGFSLIGVRAGEYGRRDPVKGAENINALDDLARAGHLKPHVGAIFDLNDSKQAFELMAGRGAMGRIVVVPDAG